MSENLTIIKIFRGNEGHYDLDLANENGSTFSSIALNVGETYARRIEACVNALVGIDTDFLERTHSKGHASGVAAHMQLEKERNELLDALSDLLGAKTETDLADLEAGLKIISGDPEDTRIAQKAINAVRNAIAHAETKP